MGSTVKDSWIYTAEYVVPDDAPLGAGDLRVEMLGRVLAHSYHGSATRTQSGWTSMVMVEADSLVHNIEQAAVQGRAWIKDAISQVSLPACAKVSEQIVATGTFHAQMETLSISEPLGTAEVCETLGITRQRLHQLRQSGRFPEPDRELTATPLWMRSTLRDFAVGWRRVPGRVPQRPEMDMDGLLATGSMRW